MSSVQLTRLRSQINALLAHFEKSEDFCRSLSSLFLLYGDKRSSINAWMREDSSLNFFNVPGSVLAELDTRLSILSRENPKTAIVNADLLWNSNDYEIKKTAINIISNLDESHQSYVIKRIHEWINPDLDKILMRDILEAFENKPNILVNEDWVKSLGFWLTSSEDEIVRLGLKALTQTITMKYKNLPQIFNALMPVIRDPKIAIQKDLVDTLKALIVQSQAETASFLIMCGNLYQNEIVMAFIRKNLPLFDSFFQKEIKTAIK